MNTLHCLRCKTIDLTETEQYPKIRFFLCPNCGRRYALKPGQQLTFRWRHEVTLALYEIIAEPDPVERAPEIARRFALWYSREELDMIVKEIRLELEEPTQRVRDTLGCRASEEELRRYLSAFCECVERLRGTGS